MPKLTTERLENVANIPPTVGYGRPAPVRTPETSSRRDTGLKTNRRTDLLLLSSHTALHFNIYCFFLLSGGSRFRWTDHYGRRLAGWAGASQSLFTALWSGVSVHPGSGIVRNASGL